MPFLTPKIRNKIKDTEVSEKIQEKKMQQFGHVERYAYERKKIEVERKRKRGTAKNDEKTV